MSVDPEIQAHKSWLGLLQPVGLVVSPPALVKAGAVLSGNVVALQQALLGVVRRPPKVTAGVEPEAYLDDFPRLAHEVLGWQRADLAGAPDGPVLPTELEVVLPDYGETLRPTYAVADPDRAGAWLLLVQVLPLGTDLDVAGAEEGRSGWEASPQAKFERLLREQRTPTGLLCNGTQLRLVYAPRGESSGHLTFPVQALCEVAGRPLLGALQLLLHEFRLFSAPNGQRLADLLEESRRYQNEVSTKLAEQVLQALWELLRGFQSADDSSVNHLLTEVAREDPQHLYGGLLTTLLRLVFLLYAEDQGLMPKDPVYVRHYSVGGLYERLREDAGRNPDTMDQRHGAWAWLLSLFRLVFTGGGHEELHLPARHGQLFDPDAFPFLEGRPGRGFNLGERLDPPRVSDGCIHRVLQGLLVLDGERLSYRALDVEQIGSVYEAIMGFAVERARGPAIGVRPHHVVVDLRALLAEKPAARAAKLKAQASCDLTGKSLDELKNATTPDEVVAALRHKVSPRTPRLLPPGALYLQPGEERRRSGSHYTPRELTEPIVRTTLRPVLEALGERPRPEQILALKVCDPAMGSGAFLVEACRQLAERLVQAWQVHDCLPRLPPDEDALSHARRLVAQRCLYGVDKNPFAVNLAKLSLWLVTLAQDHPFTFIDHALKCGDSLVGLTRAQIGAFQWKEVKGDAGPLFGEVRQALEAARGHREEIHALGDEDEYGKKLHWDLAEDALADTRLIGDLVVAAFFGADKDKGREALRKELRVLVDGWKRGEVERLELQGVVEELRSGRAGVDGRPGVTPFHWEVEFPEVFGRENPGFDCFAGNPPFLGGARIWPTLGGSYCDWLRQVHTNSGGKAVDLVAHFFRRTFGHLRPTGSLGLVATNTVAQGDSRDAGLKQICQSGGHVYSARRRLPWPGAAAVIVSVVHVQKGERTTRCSLNGTEVAGINSHLFPAAGEFQPERLQANRDKCFRGVDVYGRGFLFDDSDTSGEASTLSAMHALIRTDPRNRERIFPYFGGEELASNPSLLASRYAIYFGSMSLDEASSWPSLLDHVRKKVKPSRDLLGGYSVADHRRQYWWQYGTDTPALGRTKLGLMRVLVVPRVSKVCAFAFLPTDWVLTDKVVVFPTASNADFGLLQSRLHEVWARFFSSTLKDDLQYTPTDCFETFPFPPNWQTDPALEAAGQTYYDFRAALMIRNNEGLTKTYNRFHDPTERHPDILHLRALHAAMDRAVLDAYGWTDVPTTCEFRLDYEIDEESWGTKKKPYRYRWPEAVHDEVLARLLALNQQRAEEERLAGAAAAAAQDKQATKKLKGRPRKQADDPNLSLSLGENEG